MLLLLAGASAHSIARRAVLCGLASAGCLLPYSAQADRGKDLYTSDRAVLSGGGAFAQDVNVPKFDENGALLDSNGYSDVVAYRTVSSGSASVEVLQNWAATDGGGLRDPVTGTTASVLSLSAAPTKLASIADLGRPEQLSLVSALSLEKRLAVADLVAAAKRTVDGTVFYEFDLALPATSCDDTLATTCLPTLVVLLSAAVRDGQLHVLRIDASPAEW